jgi:hypothetical protein
MIAIAIQRPGDGKVDATTNVDVATGFLAVTNIVFAYGGFLCYRETKPIHQASLIPAQPVMSLSSVLFRR